MLVGVSVIGDVAVDVIVDMFTSVVVLVELGLIPIVVTLVIEAGAVVVLAGITVVGVTGDDVSNAVMGLFSSAIVTVLEVVSFGAYEVDTISSHSYVEQHSPIDGAISLQPINGGGEHSLTAQETSPSRHWHL